MKDNAPTRSAVYASYLSSGAPCPCRPEVARWLRGQGINRVVVGHQPQADAPFTQIVDGLQVCDQQFVYAHH
jgi:hypothetical protein